MTAWPPMDANPEAPTAYKSQAVEMQLTWCWQTTKHQTDMDVTISS